MIMRKHLLVAAASLAFAAAILAAPVQAQYDASKGEGTKGGTAKALTPQQEKMKDCAGKWKEEKAQKHVSGRDAYRAFMKGCLKG
jgi:psiF repeat